MKIKSFTLGVIVIVTIFGGVAISQAFGLWKTTSSKVPAKYQSGPFAGQYNPADIRGSYSFGDISEVFHMPVEDLAKAFGIRDDASASSFQCKELETIYADAQQAGMEIGTGSVRLFVAMYKGLPYELSEDTYLPKAAVELLKNKVDLSQEQTKYLDDHTADLNKLSATVDAEAVAVDKQETKGDYNSTEKMVKGQTTFKELLDWGVSKEEIETVIEDKLPNSTMLIKDYCSQQGKAFSDIKSALQEKVDALK
ncbi:hypothetical protein [Petroclostridium sp. X23]|uniref:hypothetical protein n=1 Tax=Petroclostridium sp. X23 TaxID=3045146 RepID=UPI0024AE4D69|nr:hypothetical protein [Petroclostridium sp. X23]WHH59208.1 hypothetical protein QKW49_00100 [Petroclostridium sp. X23]